jgi:hypothetical protein
MDYLAAVAILILISFLAILISDIIEGFNRD